MHEHAMTELEQNMSSKRNKFFMVGVLYDSRIANY